ncbi:phosphoadenosine phosphosulfate reductase family protein [Herbivorax sp. ANBcel31]|uniref:phosphoadenosine phosphosulfate reductase domain-containing protein n=1 Tax=Herbivorax sp. ANBcel31 TaxID=3069754 RepID=UPI0027B1E5CB|nr:phosphoadenosine phosphosulfate reductase family protein [Herbivorax sp. ANBcel31]MDQ2087929.1 phosphoadenosine phosphosulfate reductase family protein [Herbivorax sp. ANBcel31]
MLEKICPTCNEKTQEDIPVEIYWCDNCNVPIIRSANDTNKHCCTLCKGKVYYLTVDLRPVFPEERLLMEIIKNIEPFQHEKDAVWAATGNKYYINGLKNKKYFISAKDMKFADIDYIIKKLNENKDRINYSYFNKNIDNFIKANKDRLDYLKNEAYNFINEAREGYADQQIMVSFSGGKDSTVVSSLALRALGIPQIIHVFGDTTLEFPLTKEYVERFRKNNRQTIFRTAVNADQDFYEVCEDIGPPSRVMRWCCTMFKTGPITRTIASTFKRYSSILTFYGVRKFESASRSKFERITKNNEHAKIQKQIVASPIFFWKDIDLWLYMLAEKIDFNDAYRLGYDRVGCWCCPNNSERSLFLSKIYMSEEAKKWREYLIRFAKSIGKPDAEQYIDDGKWKARQGGYGVDAAKDVKINYNDCTTDENAKIYKLNKEMDDNFYNMFLPFGIVSKELGKKLIGEVLVLHQKTNIPIISIQPYYGSEYVHAVKIQTLNVNKHKDIKNHDDLQRMISYQIRKYNACRKCLRCESICKFGAIKITNNSYIIDKEKCKKCKMCVTAKYLDGGCMMYKYLFVSSNRA